MAEKEGEGYEAGSVGGRFGVEFVEREVFGLEDLGNEPTPNWRRSCACERRGHTPVVRLDGGVECGCGVGKCDSR